ncbi:GNAT family N-acetyltransferase [Bacillus sp. 1P06AnD]|uniref:GNAT family N-acetyltransferase n=1 Tax=Bacillus sp. 1P06AnD TaxID=3132208 RepID=UPI0039A195C1
MKQEKRVFIRLLASEDAEALLQLEMENKEFFQLYSPLKKDSFYTLDGQKERIERGIAGAEKGTLYSFGVFLKEDGNLIGSIALSEVVRGDLQSGWIGYSLDKKQNGCGYTTEAVLLAVDYGFNELKLHRIEAGVMPHNIPSIRVLEKAGFHKEGIAKENVRINGKWEDHQTLAKINDCFE